MNTFAFSSDRPLRVLLSAQNPEFKAYITDLVSRAYFNLHNAPLSSADGAWANAMVASALQVCMDARIKQHSTRALVQVFEDLIRISEEHLRESRRHASMAANAFYLREAALDHLLEQPQPHEASPVVQAQLVDGMARVSAAPQPV